MGASHPTHDITESGPEALIGQVLGGAYRVVRVLDSGGMGHVYEAQHVRLNRRLAVKIIAGHLLNNANALARFQREAEIISQLDHPHVIQVVDFDTTPEGQPFLVMEFLRGMSLEARLDRQRPLPIDEAIKIASQAASGLAAAHESNVVHRDLKPANIFLIDGGASGWPDQVFIKLLDFGISKRAGHGRGLTGEFDILGTPDYMAPEQALGKTASVDHRGDQFALAVITYEMLTGTLPFAADEVMDVLQRVIRDTPTAPSALRQGLPTAIDDVLLRALSKQPEDRFPGISEFAEALNVAAGAFGKAHAALVVPPDPKTPHFSDSALTLTTPLPPTATSATTGNAKTVPPPRNSDSPSGSRRPTSWTRKDPVETVQELIQRTRQELGLDNPQMALRYAESALNIADDLLEVEDLQKAIQGAETLFQRVFERYLGPTEAILRVGDDLSDSSNLSPQQAYLLSRVEDGSTIEEVLDLSHFGRMQTLRLVVDLIHSGYLRIERTAIMKRTPRP